MPTERGRRQTKSEAPSIQSPAWTRRSGQPDPPVSRLKLAFLGHAKEVSRYRTLHRYRGIFTRAHPVRMEGSEAGATPIESCASSKPWHQSAGGRRFEGVERQTNGEGPVAEQTNCRIEPC